MLGGLLDLLEGLCAPSDGFSLAITVLPQDGRGPDLVPA
jgi:hypothetical protein